MADLLADAKAWFKARNTRIIRTYSDDQGDYAFVVRVHGQPFIVTAKRHLHNGNASFQYGRVIQRASDQNWLVLLFVADRRLVFDPDTVEHKGDIGTTAEASRKRRGETWVDIDADLSCPFDAWVDGRDTPPSVDPSNPTGITDWGDDDG